MHKHLITGRTDSSTQFSEDISDFSCLFELFTYFCKMLVCKCKYFLCNMNLFTLKQRGKNEKHAVFIIYRLLYYFTELTLI